MIFKRLIFVIILGLILLGFYFFNAPKPIIPLRENLEMYLGIKYSNCVHTLNKAYNKDINSMVEFLKISSISGADGYEHGHILCELIN
ncbi:MAG: hypothetical protein U0V72_00895 [Cytophagales bacterium]